MELSFTLIILVLILVALGAIFRGLVMLWNLNSPKQHDFPIGIHDNLATTLTANDWQRMLRAYVGHVKQESGRNYIYAEDNRGSEFMYALTDKQYDNLKNICRRDF